MMRTITRAQYLLEQIGEEDEGAVLHLRANHRSGVRCGDCGRLLGRVHRLPAVRTCPNKTCASTYHLSRSERGLGVRKLT